MHKTILSVLSEATSSSIVGPVVLHSYPLCQQPVCVCVCVCVRRGGWREGMKDAMVNRYRRAILMTHLPVCSGEVNGTNEQLPHPPTTVFLTTCTYTIYTHHILCSICTHQNTYHTGGHTCMYMNTHQCSIMLVLLVGLLVW